ncbi:hypothetical protein NTG1052_570011 [Candidatus Nitrotoga sp. 1052]|nr:hypothetical protein NTG1052_570011 [Candidatus Nitrotoga sp. 1052]
MTMMAASYNLKRWFISSGLELRPSDVRSRQNLLKIWTIQGKNGWNCAKRFNPSKNMNAGLAAFIKFRPEGLKATGFRGALKLSLSIESRINLFYCY